MLPSVRGWLRSETIPLSVPLACNKVPTKPSSYHPKLQLSSVYDDVTEGESAGGEEFP